MRTEFSDFKISKIVFFNLSLKGVIVKCVSCFLVYLFLGGFFRLKSIKKCVCVINLKNSMLPMRSVFINVKKSMSELGCWLAAKHTTYVIYERLHNVVTTFIYVLYTFYIRSTNFCKTFSNNSQISYYLNVD